VWGPLFRRPPAGPLRRERWTTPDGDHLVLDWTTGALTDRQPAPVVVVLHGLEGSSRSHYARGLLREATRAGCRGVVVHFRSCGEDPARSRRLYHSGDTADLDWAVRRLAAREPGAALAVVGVSLGGNVLLKWLGEQGSGVPPQVVAGVAISTPFDLQASTAVLDRGLRRLLYTAAFLRTLKAKVRARVDLLAGLVDVGAAVRARTFAAYDRRVTAPLFGFRDERDYWARSSSGPYLAAIRRPCLLINALNDPLVPAATLPRAALAGSPWIRAAFVAEGGHAGFLEGPAGQRSWAERVAVRFLRRFW
jgi:hypothetical protein